MKKVEFFFQSKIQCFHNIVSKVPKFGISSNWKIKETKQNNKLKIRISQLMFQNTINALFT